MYSFILKLCWKNMWRNRRRTLLTVNAIGVGVMSLVWLYNYYDAFHNQLVDNAIRYHSGHLLITHPGYQKEKLPGKFLSNPAKFEAWLKARPEVIAYSSHVLVQGMLSSPRGSANILFRGVEPAAESKTTKFAANITHGAFFGKTKRKEIVIGQRLGELLKIKVGDKVVALTQGIDGSIGNELFFVAGIFETKSEADKSLAFLRRDDAAALLSLPNGAVHQVSVVLKHQEELRDVKNAFSSKFIGKDVTILSWSEVQRHLVALIELDRAANRILMAIILFIAALGIVNSILMGILERTREFGVMMAVGTSKSEVMAMVTIETFLMAAVGVFLGNVFGYAITLYFNKWGFDLRWLTDQDLVVNGAIIQTVSYPTMQWGNSLFITGIILVLSLFIAVIPIRHIAKLNTVKALRAH